MLDHDIRNAINDDLSSVIFTRIFIYIYSQEESYLLVHQIQARTVKQ